MGPGGEGRGRVRTHTHLRWRTWGPTGERGRPAGRPGGGGTCAILTVVERTSRRPACLGRTAVRVLNLGRLAVTPASVKGGSGGHGEGSRLGSTVLAVVAAVSVSRPLEQLTSSPAGARSPRYSHCPKLLAADDVRPSEREPRPPHCRAGPTGSRETRERPPCPAARPASAVRTGAGTGAVPLCAPPVLLLQREVAVQGRSTCKPLR